MIEALSTILVPGGRARISPYVEDAQFKVLFGVVADPQERHASGRSILHKCAGEVQKLADSYARFSGAGLRFVPETYQADAFLRLYLAYYFTTNVSKMQLCLLDLVRGNHIPQTLRVVDIGVGAGTTAVAVLDFLLAWATACHLVGIPFPVTALTIECHDMSDVCLETAGKSVAAFCDSVERRRQLVFGQKTIAPIMDQIVSWGRSIEWRRSDISKAPIQHPDDSQVLLVASNVLNELPLPGQHNIAAAITSMPAGSKAIVIEPGDRASCCGLNSWKSSLLQRESGLATLFPCGQDVRDDSSSCRTCWNARRESLHEPVLYRSLRERTADKRGFDEYSNSLLSWSYVCFIRRQRVIPGVKVTPRPSGVLRTRVMGTIRQRTSSPGWHPHALDPNDSLTGNYVEYIKLCPIEASLAGVHELWAQRGVGFILPPFPHGTPVVIANANVKKTKREGAWSVSLDQGVDIHAQSLPTPNNSFLPSYSEASREAVDEIAFRLFGFTTMRPFQHEILARVLTGRSILGIAATGGGKSECYILPAMLFPGLTLVISPLKSLMQDQFEKRIDERYGLRNLTTCINGDVPFAERQARLKRLELGHYKLAYFTPEQLRQSHVMNSLKRAHAQMGIRYLALDEAHCISQWGHDFRDSYLNLVARLENAGINPVRIALTATASPEVRADLCEELQLSNSPLASGGDVYVHSSNRVELNLIVKPVLSTEDKTQDIIERLQTFMRANANVTDPDAAIVFMPLTGTDPDTPQWYLPDATGSSGKGRFSAGVTNFASYLERSLDTRVAIYHGKMDFDRDETTGGTNEQKRLGDLSGRSRRSEQTAFIDGQRSLMVATKGFGMGIDKPNIRLIIHRTPTANLEAYAQEAGRAGRDGEISDVVLYYSPDSSEDDATVVRSDYEIQDFFLTQKYIRRDDVVAMKTFLATVRRDICGFRYFTSDEILPFFDNLEAKGTYEWPSFPPRLKRGFETDEHAAILERGHRYSERIRYVDRILSALYRIRPDVGAVRRACILASVQDVGAVIKCRSSSSAVLNGRAIIESNAYFGELLRDKSVTPAALGEWVTRCRTEDTVAFARTLNLSLSETASMLWDINRADGVLRNGRWKPALLDFLFIATPKYGVAAGRTSLSEWRDYAGAGRRASVSNARSRAEDARASGQERRTNSKGQIVPSDDDWFGPREMIEPKGWEVLPGVAFDDESLFDKYLDAFMAVHDRRQANDRAAYRLLLTDYVGVNEDGTLSSQSEGKPCLRAVLLGYLKTGEVVLSNCRSCSRCSPDGKFERDPAKRLKIVERLGTEITDLLDALENSHSTFPSSASLQTLWNHVATQEELGRSLRAYVEGWTGRLLTDRPGHKTALWVRVDGMVRNLLPLQQQEACARALEIVGAASPEELTAIWDTISLFQKVMPDLPEALVVRASASQRMNRFEESRDLWQAIVGMRVARDVKHNACSALCRLFDPSGPLPNAEEFRRYALQAARSASEFPVVESFYKRIQETWTWTDIRAELLIHDDGDGRSGQGARLVAWWVDSQSSVRKLADRPTPDGWTGVIDESLSCIAEESTKSEHLAKMLSGAIDRWSVSLLQQTPGLCAVRALRIALIASAPLSHRDTLVHECLAFLKGADADHMNWIAGLIEAGRMDSNHQATQVVLAELASRNGNHVAADAYWRTYIESPPPESPQEVIDHVLSRLADLHRPAGPLPDQPAYHTALLARAARAREWEEAESHYRHVIPDWTAPRLEEYIRKLAQSRDATWPIRLMALWMTIHERAKDSDILLMLLGEVPKAVRDANAETVSTILQHAHPRAVVADPVFGPPRLQAAVQSAMARREAALSPDVRLGTSTAKERPGHTGLRPSREDVEVLVCAALASRLGTDTATRIALGSLVFTEPCDEAGVLSDSEYAAACREDVIAGRENILFSGYEPDSVKALDRWLSWFGPLVAGDQDHAARIVRIADELFRSALTRTRAEVERCSAVLMKHGLQTRIQEFAVVKSFIDVIARIERTTDVATVHKLEGGHLGALEHATTPLQDALHADILVSLLRCIRARTKASWMTPLSRLVEALVLAGRMDEASAVGSTSNLTVGRNRLPVDVFIARSRSARRAAPAYDAMLGQLADLFVRTWQFR